MWRTIIPEHMQWIDRYRTKLRTAEEAVRVIESGQRVYVHPGCAMPEVLVDAMSARYRDLEDVEVLHLLTVGKRRVYRPQSDQRLVDQARQIAR